MAGNGGFSHTTPFRHVWRQSGEIAQCPATAIAPLEHEVLTLFLVGVCIRGEPDPRALAIRLAFARQLAEGSVICLHLEEPFREPRCKVAQLHGSKKWVLFPPADTASLSATRVPYEESSVFSRVDARRPDLGRYGVPSCCESCVSAERVTIGGVLPYGAPLFWHCSVCSLCSSNAIRQLVPVGLYDADCFTSAVLLRFACSEDGEVLNPSSYAHPSSSRPSALHSRFPQFAEAHPLVATLEPGDVLFVPNHWWHFVEAVETSLSVNVWLKAPGDPENRCSESVARVLMTSLSGGLDAEVCIHRFYLFAGVYFKDAGITDF